MTLTTMTMTIEAAITRITERVNAGALCWRCGLGHGDMHPVAGSGRVEHVDNPACDTIPALLVAVRDQLGEVAL